MVGAAVTPSRLHFHLSAHGIGDAVVGLYAACGLADAGREVVFHCRRSDWLAGLSHPGVAVEPWRADAGVDANADYAGQLRAAHLGSCQTRAQWYCDNISRTADIPAFAPKRPRFVDRPPPVIPPGYTLIAPYTHADRTREWPDHKWRELLGRLHPRRVVAVGENLRRPRLRATFARCEVFVGKPAGVVSSLVANADFVYGVDSGLSHLAGLYGVPGAVVMVGLPFRFVFGEADSLRGFGPGDTLPVLPQHELDATLRVREQRLVGVGE